MTSGMIRIRHSIGAFDTIGKLSFSRTQSTSNAPVSVMRLGYVKLRVGRVRWKRVVHHDFPLFLSSFGDIGAPTIVEPRFPASSVVYGQVYNISTGKVVEVESGIHQSNPAKVHSTSHGFNENDVVRVSGVVGMDDVPWNLDYIVRTVTPDTFELQGLNANSSSAYLWRGYNPTKSCICNV